MTLSLVRKTHDDIFIIYTDGVAKLKNSQTNLKMIYDSIEFDHQKSTRLTAFLVFLVYIDKNSQVDTFTHKTH